MLYKGTLEILFSRPPPVKPRIVRARDRRAQRYNKLQRWKSSTTSLYTSRGGKSTKTRTPTRGDTALTVHSPTRDPTQFTSQSTIPHLINSSPPPAIDRIKENRHSPNFLPPPPSDSLVDRKVPCRGPFGPFIISRDGDIRT